ncbi:MAG TPA: PKD domain-containing protein [Thermoanaerobaculia bacterium]|jgi:PKD repeat protein
MLRFPVPLVLLVVVFLFACDSGNPVAPTDTGTPPPSGAVILTVTANQSRVEAGSNVPATLTITARQNNAPVADNTEVAINTNLGYFSLDSAGKPVQLTTARLTGGTAIVQFFAGSDAGTATILAQVGTSVGRLNLPVVNPPALPSADFSFEVSGTAVLFTNLSTGSPTSYRWQFGDGTESTAVTPPQHDYKTPGSYTVTLTASNGAGSSSKSKFVTVTAAPAVNAAFTFEAAGLKVLFTDASSGTPVSWLWTFGDGGISTEKNPSHTYERAGSYEVSLTVGNAFGSTSSTRRFVTVTLGEAPRADFTFEVSGLKVLFTDTSTGGTPTDWLWNFGDCATTSPCTALTKNAEHTFTAPGTYEVTLSVTNAAGSSSKSRFVTVAIAPVAAFDFSVNGFNVAFTDRSTNNPTQWAWDFGCAGCTSTEQNPTFTYPRAGSYTVTLKVTNSAGTNSISKVVQVRDAQAFFTYQTNGLTVTFQDRSAANVTSRQWNFGDCEPSSQGCLVFDDPNPTHTYAAAGTYTVSLTIITSSGQQATNTQEVTVAP